MYSEDSGNYIGYQRSNKDTFTLWEGEKTGYGASQMINGVVHCPQILEDNNDYFENNSLPLAFGRFNFPLRKHPLNSLYEDIEYCHLHERKRRRVILLTGDNKVEIMYNNSNE